MNDVYIGKCRQDSCGTVIAAYSIPTDTIERVREAAAEADRMVDAGLDVERVTGPVTVQFCRHVSKSRTA